jgi:hypothetical protein
MEGGVFRRAQVKLGLSGIAKHLSALAKTIHPVRALFEVCGTVVVSIPFLVAFFMNESAPLAVYLLYPALFLVSHLVWFRLPFADLRVRWSLFWFSLTAIIALGSGFLYWDFRSAAALPSAPLDFPPIPAWMWPPLDVPFPKITVSFLIPSALAALLYCFVLSLFLRVYRAFRHEERARRNGERGNGSS